MKPQLLALFLMVFTSACGGGGSGKTRPDKAVFQVKVSETDAEGGLWDRLDADGKPDIAICIESQLGKRCYPDNKLYNSHCPDSFSCNFGSLPIPAEKFTVTVIDVDAINNETIGESTCDWDETCKVGLAKVTIK